MKIDPEFQKLRDQWALKHVPSQSQIDMERTRDRNANPHNDSYHNKKPIREESQIISDLSYTFADNVLIAQYGSDYKYWLDQNDYNEVWHVVKRI